MKAGAPDDVLSGTAGWRSHVSSWLADEFLWDDIPIVRGRLDVDGGQQVPERLTLRVPEYADRKVWRPGMDHRHPIAAYGQRLDATVIVRSVVSHTEWPTRLGQFGVQAWDFDDTADEVAVEALGALQRVKDDRFPAPVSPRRGGTLASEFRRLMIRGVPVLIHADLVNRRCPSSFQWDEDRLAALYDIAKAWPARLRTSQHGEVMLLPPLPSRPDPVLTFTHGERGTLVSAPQSDTRDGVYNAVVVRATSTDDPAKAPVQAEAVMQTGPYSVHGPYGVVRRFFSSPLVETVEQAQRTAESLLRSGLRRASTIRCSIVPDPRIDLDVPVRVVRDGVDVVGWVNGYSLPLTPTKDPQMTVTVGVHHG